MSRDTPASIVDALHVADMELDLLSKQYAWFKGQKDFWKDVYALAIAREKVKDKGPVTKSGDVALVNVAVTMVDVSWLDGVQLGLLDMVRLTESSFDLISKRYAKLETHIMVLMAVNKNVMLDYNVSSRREF